jgi:PIN domain nuclease of toxin-antitoxin system
VSGVKKPRVSRAVLDSSAILALLFKEPGCQEVAGCLPGSLLSAVNLSEVVTKAVDTGMTLEETRLVVAGLPCELVPFDGEHAFLAAALRGATRAFGLSLGDRACLALGLNTGHPVVTADRMWEKCDVGVQVIRIR